MAKFNNLYYGIILVLVPVLFVMEITKVCTPVLQPQDGKGLMEKVQFNVENLELKLANSRHLEFKMAIEQNDMEELIERIQSPEGRHLKLLRVEPLMHNPNYCFTADYHSPLDESDDGGDTKPDQDGELRHGSFSPTRGWLPVDERLKNSSGVRIDWIFYVHTSVDNTAKRQIIRKSWGYPRLFKDHNMRILFVVGKTDSQNSQRRLEMEYSLYGDILQGDFKDTYKNITYKAVFTLRWLTTYCGHVPIVMKADDDTFVNIFHMKNYLVRYSKFPPNPEEEEEEEEGRGDKDTPRIYKTTPKTGAPKVVPSKTIICNLYEEGSMTIYRKKGECMKWCLSHLDLPGMTVFPPYCSGLLYFFTMPLVRKLYEKVSSTPFLWIDDVYITGLLPQTIKNIHYVDIGSQMTLNSNNASAEYKNLSRPIELHVVHVRDPRAFALLWNSLLDRLTEEQMDDLSVRPERLKLRTTLL